MANQNQNQIPIADAFNAVNQACRRVRDLSMDEGLVLNQSLALIKQIVEQRIAAEKILRGGTPEDAKKAATADAKKAATAAKKKAATAAKKKAATAAKKKNRKRG